MSFLLPLIAGAIELAPEIISAVESIGSVTSSAMGAADLLSQGADVIPQLPDVMDDFKTAYKGIKNISDVGQKIGEFGQQIGQMGLSGQMGTSGKVEEAKAMILDPSRIHPTPEISPSQELGRPLTGHERQQLLLGNTYTKAPSFVGGSDDVQPSMGPMPPERYGYGVSLLANPVNAIVNNSLNAHGFGNRAMMYSMRGGNFQSPYSAKTNMLNRTRVPLNPPDAPPDATNPIGIDQLQKPSRLSTNRFGNLIDFSAVRPFNDRKDQRLINRDINESTAGYPFKMGRGIIIN
jgi:hypothetical protein